MTYVSNTISLEFNKLFILCQRRYLRYYISSLTEVTHTYIAVKLDFIWTKRISRNIKINKKY